MTTPAAPTPAIPQRQTTAQWRKSGEVGSVWGIAFVAGLAQTVGRPAARAFLWLVTFYFFASRPDRVAACREFRGRAGAGTSSWEIFQHLLHFAHCALDRLYFLTGRFELFRIFQKGHEHMMRLAEEGRGAILLGCHLGSFEALRAASRKHDLPLSIVADFDNAQRLNAILSYFGDNTSTRFLDASGDRVALGLSIRETVDAGGLVAILSDRAGYGRSVEVDFLGGRAPLPVGAYLLAAIAKCPVYFTTAFYCAPNRYELVCEPFAEQILLPRHQRQAALTEYAQMYARRLEYYAKTYPDNWFNFYSFWSPPHA